MRTGILLAAGAAVAGAAGFAAGARHGFEEGYALAFVTDALDTMYMARIHLRDEEMDEPDRQRKELLDLWIDSGLVTLLHYGDVLEDVPFYAPAELEKIEHWERYVRNVAAYRRDHPSAHHDPEVAALVQAALARYGAPRDGALRSED